MILFTCTSRQFKWTQFQIFEIITVFGIRSGYFGSQTTFNNE